MNLLKVWNTPVRVGRQQFCGPLVEKIDKIWASGQRQYMGFLQPLFGPLRRWTNDLKAVYALVKNPDKQTWFIEGEIDSDDVAQSVWIVGLSFVSAFLVLVVKSYQVMGLQGEAFWKPMIQFLATPVQVVTNGFLMACFIFIGAHFNKSTKHFPVAFKTALRMLSIYPLLGLLFVWHFGAVIMLLVYAFIVPRAVVAVYGIPERNAKIFFSSVYCMFALLQLQALLR